MIMQNEEINEFSFDDIINPFSLKFIDKEIEKKYMHHRNKNDQSKKTVILTSFFSGGFICLRILETFFEYLLVANPLNADLNFYIACVLVGFSTLAFEIVLLVTNRIRILKGILFVLSLFLVGLISSYRNTMASANPVPYIAPQGIPIYSITIAFALIYSYNWITGIILTSTGNIGCIIYICLYPSLLITKIFLAFNYILSTIALCTCIRFLEYQRRQNFYITYQAKLHQQNLKTILMRFPDPIIVAQKGNVIFANDSFNKIEENNISESSESIVNDMNLLNLNNEKITENALKLIDTKTNSSFLSQIKSELEIKKAEFSLINSANSNKMNFVIDSTKINFTEFNQIVYSFKNITTYYELIEIKSKVKYSRMFVSSISHEFRTNLNIIMGSLENIEYNNHLNINEIDSFLNIKYSSSILAIIVNNLIDYSMLQDNTFTLNIHSFKIKNIFDELIKMFKNKFEDKSLYFSFKKEENVPETIISDSMRIKQVVSNFITNALKFTLKGGVTIVINGRSKEQIIDISIQDTGIGIPQEEIPKLLKPFSKLEDQLNLNPNGIGLGLHICDKIVQKLGGKITIESFIGVGSKFTSSIPYSIESSFVNTS